jgi:hypothetical protein
MPGKAAELKAMIDQWRKDVGAEMMDKNPIYNPEYRRSSFGK